MAIKKTLHNRPQVGRQSIQAGRRPVTANTGVTAGARRRGTQTNILASQSLRKLSPEKQNFARQLQATARKMSVMGATNTNNIAAKPEFIELLPLFVQKLLVLDVFGSVAMNSRQQLVPYFKVKAENTKGETQKGTIFSSPFVNTQGVDPNFTGRLVRNETVTGSPLALTYVPVLPGSVSISVTSGTPATTTVYADDGQGAFVDASGSASGATIDYATGTITGTSGTVVATYEYDNEFVGPNADGAYGASMGKFDLQLDEINLIAEAHEVASYWSIYSAFAAQQEYGANIADMSKEAAFSQLTAEINSKGFKTLADAAAYKPQFNWDASPILSGAVMPSDYLNMFKLKLEQAAASIYQATRLSQPNRLIVGTTAGAYIGMINGFQAENTTDNVGPYKLGVLGNFDVFVDPNYDANTWVMSCKSQDIRRNSALFGEYMPFTETAPIGLADLSVQSGYATMYAMKVVNPATVVSGKILGQF